MKKFSEELEELLEKHKIKIAIVLVEQSKPYSQYRVVAVSDNEKAGECEYAHLLGGCINGSKGMQGIMEHVGKHSISTLLDHLADEKLSEIGIYPDKRKRAD